MTIGLSRCDLLKSASGIVHLYGKFEEGLDDGLSRA
jgi:hypothetical protein